MRCRIPCHGAGTLRPVHPARTVAGGLWRFTGRQQRPSCTEGGPPLWMPGTGAAAVARKTGYGVDAPDTVLGIQSFCRSGRAQGGCFPSERSRTGPCPSVLFTDERRLYRCCPSGSSGVALQAGRAGAVPVGRNVSPGHFHEKRHCLHRRHQCHAGHSRHGDSESVPNLRR